MKHILLINHTRSVHGAEQVLLTTLQNLKDAGHRVTLVLPKQVPDNGIDSLIPKIDKTLYLPYKVAGVNIWRTLAIMLYNLPAMLYLACWARKEHVDIVYSNTSTTILGIGVAWLTQKKHLWHFHESANHLYGWDSSLAPFYRILARYPRNTQIYLSESQKREWKDEIGEQTAVVIYNPVRTLTPIDKVPHETIRFGYIGSFDTRKNLSCLLRTFEQIHLQNPQTELWVCGAGNEQEIATLQNQITLKEPVIRILPHTNDAQLFYAQIDILVLPSKKEVMPLVVIEAMMAGIAVIQTSESGMMEIMNNKKDCLFTDPNNDSSLMQAMQQLIDGNLREQLAEHGQNTILKTNFNQLYKQTMEQLI